MSGDFCTCPPPPTGGIGSEAARGVRCGEGGGLFTVGKILNFASKRPPNQPVFHPSDECPMTFAQHCRAHGDDSVAQNASSKVNKPEIFCLGYRTAFAIVSGPTLGGFALGMFVPWANTVVSEAVTIANNQYRRTVAVGQDGSKDALFLEVERTFDLARKNSPANRFYWLEVDRVARGWRKSNKLEKKKLCSVRLRFPFFLSRT